MVLIYINIYIYIKNKRTIYNIFAKQHNREIFSVLSFPKENISTK